MSNQRIDSKDFLEKNEYILKLKSDWEDADYMRYSKIAGSLFAGALGDALGYEIEFDKWPTIRKQYGINGIQNLSLGDKGKAIISDDTQMTLFTCEGMLLGLQRAREGESNESLESYIHESYLNWMQTQGYKEESQWDNVSKLITVNELFHKRLPGITCLDALRLKDYGLIDRPINNSKGCGGVMRTAPLGYTKVWGNPLLNGAGEAAITHSHPLGWIPGGVLSDIVFQIIYEDNKLLKEVVTESLQRANRSWGDIPECRELMDLMHKAIDLAETELPVRSAIDKLSSNPYKGGGWTGEEAIAIAVFCCLRYPDDILACLRASVNHNGDSDSTGAIAGNILGAYLGLECIPADWLEIIELREVLEAYAILMTDMDRCV